MTDYFNVFLAVCYHSWGWMNGASWMEAVRRHKREENNDSTQLLESLSVIIVMSSWAGEHRGPESIRLHPPCSFVEGADAGEAGEGRHPTSA